MTGFKKNFKSHTSIQVTNHSPITNSLNAAIVLHIKPFESLPSNQCNLLYISKLMLLVFKVFNPICMSYSRFPSLFATVCLVFFFLCLSSTSKGQPAVPEYHNLDTSTLYGNGFPLAGGSNQVQYIFAPGALKKGGFTGSSSPNGAISVLYIKLHASFTSSATYSDFTLKLAQNVDTNTYWRSAAWDTALTTVFYKKSMTISDTAHRWLKVPLQSKFNYDASKSLVLNFQYHPVPVTPQP